MDINIALLPGDGIGPEIIAEATKVLDRTAAKFGHRIRYTEALVGAAAIDATGNPYPDTTHCICREADAVLAASVFHFGTFSIRQVKEYMASQGIPVRLDF